MTRENDDWSDLQAAWRQDRPDPDSAFAERLRAQVLRERRRSRGEAAAEIAVSAFCVGVFLWWALGAEGGARILFTALALATVASVLVTSVLRWNVWRAQAAAVADYQRLLRRRAQLGLAFARIGYVGAPLGVGLGMLVAPVARTAAIPSASLAHTAIAAVAVAALAAGCIWALREARRHRQTLAALDADGE